MLNRVICCLLVTTLSSAAGLRMQGNNAFLASNSLKNAGGTIIRCPDQLSKERNNAYLCAEFLGTRDQAVAAWNKFADLINYTPGTEWGEVLNPIGHLPNDPRNNGAARGYYFQDTKFLFVTAPISLPQGSVQNRMLMYLSTGKTEPQIKTKPLK
ncbi:hypothetical protein [Deinococcus sp. UYEF24]